MAAGSTDNYADDKIRRFEKAKTYRSNFENVWREIALRVLPRADDFVTKHYPGTKRDEYVYDSTAQLALPAFAAAMESMLTPRTQKWHSLKPAALELQKDDEVLRYLENVRDILFSARYSPNANFASQSYELYMSLGAFGTGCMFIEDGLSKGIRYMHIPLSEIYILEDAQGVVDTVFWAYTRTVRQAYQKWGDALPEEVLKHKDKDPEKEFNFLHVVEPNDEQDKSKKNYKGMAYRACDIIIEGKKVLKESGYRTMPFAVSRYTTAPREIYGRSPAWDALADIKTLNEMSKTGLRYAQLVTDPPWLTADVDSLSPFALRPGAVNPGYINDQGVVLAKSMAPGGNPRITLEMADQRRTSINRSFLVTLFQILVDTPQMTATEAMLRAQEKGSLLAPTVGRQQSEFLGTLISREIDIHSAAGRIPPMPEKLRAAGGFLDIQYDSPLTRAQKAEEGVGILRTLEGITPLANIDPKMLKRVNADRTLKRLADINGAPMDMLYTDDEMAAINEQEAAAAAAAQLVQAAPQVAKTAKDLAQANAISQAAPF